jgi:hypothetical protein
VNSQEAIEFYRKSAVSYARSLPLPAAVAFLKGALAISGTHPDMIDVRRAYESLVVGDDQLELIAGPQPQLNLTGGVSQ